MLETIPEMSMRERCKTCYLLFSLRFVNETFSLLNHHNIFEFVQTAIPILASTYFCRNSQKTFADTMMFFDLYFVRYWNSLPRLRLSVLLIVVWSLIIIFASYLYIGSWSPNGGLEVVFDIIPDIFKPQKQVPDKDTAINLDLDQWLSKYPKVEPYRNCCISGKSGNPAFNTTTDCWSGYRVGRWGNHHKSQNKELMDPNQTCEYIFIGDSITFHWKGNQDIFDANFNTDHNGIIYAHGGDVISDIGWRLKHGDGFKNMKQCLLNHSLPQKSIVLNIGTNDLGYATPYDVVLKDYEHLLKQLSEFLNDVNKEQRVVLNVMAIFPRGREIETPCPRCEWDGNNTMFQSINFVNEYLESFVEYQGNDNMRFIDCNRNLLQHVGSVEWTDIKGETHEYLTGHLNTTILPDRLHLSDYGRHQGSGGYKLWAECLKMHLK